MTRNIAIALAAAAALAACDRPADRSASTDAKAPAASAPTTAPSSTAGASQTPTTPANLPNPPTTEEKREGANPQQGQVDPKEREQHRDFQQKGDGAGPTSPETTPRK